MNSGKTKTNKLTTVLTSDLRAEVDDLSAMTGLGGADLLRQGLIRLIKEVREHGKFEVVQLPPRAA